MFREIFTRFEREPSAPKELPSLAFFRSFSLNNFETNFPAWVYEGVVINRLPIKVSVIAESEMYPSVFPYHRMNMRLVCGERDERWSFFQTSDNLRLTLDTAKVIPLLGDSQGFIAPASDTGRGISIALKKSHIDDRDHLFEQDIHWRRSYIDRDGPFKSLRQGIDQLFLLTEGIKRVNRYRALTR